MDLIFEVEDLSLAFELQSGTRSVLNKLNLSTREGEILAIVGGSGTGKTSLLRILGGLMRHTGGAVKFRGRTFDTPQAGIAIVFQDYSNALLQWRTVARNVALGIERFVSKVELEKRVESALRLVGLTAYAQDYPWRLSGGMQQRVQIARALAVQPSVLLMDEPFAALDAMTKASMQDELLRLRDKTGTSIVFITHDIEEAIYLGDHVAMLSGRPATISRTFDVGLTSSRSQVLTREDPTFLALRHEIHQALDQKP